MEIPARNLILGCRAGNADFHAIIGRGSAGVREFLGGKGGENARETLGGACLIRMRGTRWRWRSMKLTIIPALYALSLIPAILTRGGGVHAGRSAGMPRSPFNADNRKVVKLHGEPAVGHVDDGD